MPPAGRNSLRWPPADAGSYAGMSASAHARGGACRNHPANQRTNTMNQGIALGLTLLAGVAIGATAIQGLHAQAKPPAYVVIPILKINDAAGFKAGVVDKANATAAEMTAAGGQYVIRSEKFTGLDGTPPARLVIMKF